MTEQIPPLAEDESAGDQADQASRLQMVEEQAAIQAALAGDVEGTDALDDRSEVGDMLEGPDPLDSADASDDPVYGGGMPVTDPSESGEGTEPEFVDDLTADVEGGAGGPSDEPELREDAFGPDEEAAAEDLDALIDVSPLGHDLDDPENPDGYGVPPAADAGTAVIDEARMRDPVAEQ